MQLSVLYFIWQPSLQGPCPAEVEQRSPLALMSLHGSNLGARGQSESSLALTSMWLVSRRVCGLK